MKSHKAGICLLLAILSFAPVSLATDEPKLTFKFTTVQIKNALDTGVYGVNNAGVMVGQYIDSDGIAHGFELVGKKVTELDDPSGSDTLCYAINSKNVIVGSYAKGSTTQAFIYREGKFSDIGPSGATFSVAEGINDKGFVAGIYIDSAGQYQGFVWDGKNYTTWDVPNAIATGASGINDEGWITFHWTDKSGHTEAALYDGKGYKIIDVPHAVLSDANAIDSAGDVVYSWIDPAGLTHGALRTGGRYYTFDDPRGASGTAGIGINDHRLIVGLYLINGGSTAVGFKATY